MDGAKKRFVPIPSPPRLPRYIPSLDGLRAVSIGLVFLAHVGGTAEVPAFLARLERIGNLGVKVFFVISGFLITTLLLKEHAQAGRISLKNFYLRRTVRIFPAFYAYIFVSVLLYLFGVVLLKQNDILYAVTYTMNYHDERAWQLNHLWSLAVEEQFYLVWPLLLCALGPRRALICAAAAVLIAPTCRALMWYSFDASPTALTRRFQAVADALATGCLLAGFYNRLGEVRWYVQLLASRLFLFVPGTVLLVGLATAAHSRGLYYVVGQSICNFAIVICLHRYVLFPGTLGGRILNSRPLVFVGILSYSLYLWQEPFLIPMDVEPSYGKFATSFPQNVVFAIGAALASYYLVEKQFLKLKPGPGRPRTEQVPSSE